MAGVCLPEAKCSIGLYSLMTLKPKAIKGWPPIAKLEKIQDVIVRFGCNLGDLIAYLCRLLTPVDTQIGQC